MATADAEALEQRLQQLETKLSFQEHSIEELEEGITAQQRQFEELLKQFELLKTRYQALLELADRSAIEPGFEKPPHY